MFRIRSNARQIAFAVLLVAGSAFVAMRAAAQDPSKLGADAQRAAMAKLDYMVGDWHGTGWMDRGERSTFAGSERVQRKLDGLALLVEGDFAASTDPGRSVHKTLGVIYYDPQKNVYRFDTWLAVGSHGEHELEVLDDGWRWEIEFPGGTVRYTMRRNTKGEWFEIGERTNDNGTNWIKFFEMTLAKRTD
jgi:hypothetical protein